MPSQSYGLASPKCFAKASRQAGYEYLSAEELSQAEALAKAGDIRLRKAAATCPDAASRGNRGELAGGDQEIAIGS